MKFAKELADKEDPAFAGHYIPYKRLKKLLADASAVPPGASPSERTDALSRVFLAALQEEMQKVDAFVATQHAALRAEAARVAQLRAALAQMLVQASPVRRTASVRNPAPSFVEERRALSGAEAELWRGVHALHAYAELNYTAVYKAGKKHDKLLGRRALHAILLAAESMPWMAVVQLSAAAAAEGMAGSGGDDSDNEPLLQEVPVGRAQLTIAEALAAERGGGSGGDTSSHGEEDAFPAAERHRLLGFLRPSSSFISTPTSPTSRQMTPAPMPAATTAAAAAVSPERKVSALRISMEQEQGATPLFTIGAIGADDPATPLRPAAVDVTTAQGVPDLSVLLPPPTASTPQQQPRLPPLRYSIDVPSSQHLTKSDRDVSAALAADYGRALVALRGIVEASLQVISPELEGSNAGECECSKLLADFTTELREAHKRVVAKSRLRARAAPTPTRLREVILASKVELFALAQSTVTRQLSLSLPDMAAGLELLSAAHHTLFGQYAHKSARAPSHANFDLLEGLKRGALHPASASAGGLSELQGGNDNTAVAISPMPVSSTDSVVGVTFRTWADLVLSFDPEAVVDRYTSDSSLASHNATSALPSLSQPSLSGSSVGDVVEEEEGGGGGGSSADGVASLRGLGLWPHHRSPSKRSKRGIPSSRSLYLGDASAPGLSEHESAPRSSGSADEGGIAAAAAAAAPGAMPSPSSHDAASAGLHTSALFSRHSISSAPVMSSSSSTARSVIHWLLLGRGLSGSEHESALLPPAAAAASDSWTTLLHELVLRYRPAAVGWLPNYKIKWLAPDVVAGVTIGVLLIPQGLACAILANVPPVVGIYAGFPSAIYALFGSSRHAAIGPMSIPSLILSTGVLSAYANAPLDAESFVGVVTAITFLNGALLFLMGACNLGFLVRFVSRPVLQGFTSAAAVLTALSVVKDLIGVPLPPAQVLQDYLAMIVNALPLANGFTVATSVAAIILMLAFARILPTRLLKVLPPSILVVCGFIALFAAILAATGDSGAPTSPSSTSFATRMGVRLVGPVPAVFPSLRLPPLTLDTLNRVLPTVLSTTLVAFIEHITIVRNTATKHGYDANASSELRALGVTNMAGAFMQSLPVMGAFGRSAVNEATGARSQLSGIISMLCVVIILAVATPALYFLPKAVLSSVIAVAVLGLVDVSSAVRLWRTDRRDCFVMAAAALATLFLGVLYGVVSAVLLSLIIFLGLTTQPRVEELGRVEGTVVYRHLGLIGVRRVQGVQILRFLAPLFFANAPVLKDRIAAELLRRSYLPPRLRWRALILCFQAVASVDSTSVQLLIECAAECHANRVPLIIASANAYVELAFERAGLPTALAQGVAANAHHFLHRRVHDAVHAVFLGHIPLLPPARAARSPVRAAARSWGQWLASLAPVLHAWAPLSPRGAALIRQVRAGQEEEGGRV